VVKLLLWFQTKNLSVSARAKMTREETKERERVVWFNLNFSFLTVESRERFLCFSSSSFFSRLFLRTLVSENSSESQLHSKRNTERESTLKSSLTLKFCVLSRRTYTPQISEAW